MISEIVLSLTLLGFLIYHIVYVRDSNKRFHQILKATMAKNLGEYDVSTRVEAEVEKKGKLVDKAIMDMPEFIPAEEASDELFEKHIQAQFE